MGPGTGRSSCSRGFDTRVVQASAYADSNPSSFAERKTGQKAGPGPPPELHLSDVNRLAVGRARHLQQLQTRVGGGLGVAGSGRRLRLLPSLACRRRAPGGPAPLKGNGGASLPFRACGRTTFACSPRTGLQGGCPSAHLHNRSLALGDGGGKHRLHRSNVHQFCKSRVGAAWGK